jgi:hypothetical protein
MQVLEDALGHLAGAGVPVGQSIDENNIWIKPKPLLIVPSVSRSVCQWLGLKNILKC